MFRVIWKFETNDSEMLDEGVFETEAAAEACIRENGGAKMERAIIVRPIAEFSPETRIVRRPLTPQMGGVNE